MALVASRAFGPLAVANPSQPLREPLHDILLPGVEVVAGSIASASSL